MARRRARFVAPRHEPETATPFRTSVHAHRRVATRGGGNSAILPRPSRPRGPARRPGLAARLRAAWGTHVCRVAGLVGESAARAPRLGRFTPAHGRIHAIAKLITQHFRTFVVQAARLHGRAGEPPTPRM